jgi:amino acid transporter
VPDTISTPSGASTPEDYSASSGGGFQRRSSGLVRDFSPTDSWMYNVLAMNPIVIGALTFGLVLTTYPGASLWLCFVIAGLFCCAEAVAYALFTSAMPRSGGDYVMQSRVLGGGVASVTTFAGITLSQCFLPGIVGYLLSSIVLAPFFLIAGAQYDAAWMIDVGTWLGTNFGVLVCALIVAVLGTLTNIRGLQLYARIQRIVFWPGLIILLFFMVQLLVNSQEHFVSSFNGFMSSNYGVSDAYAGIIEAGGRPDSGFSLGDTIKASVIGAFLLIFPAYSAQQAGEIRRASNVRSNLWSMLGSEVFTFVLMAVLGAILVSQVGKDFLFASSSLYFSGSGDNPLPVPPFFGFFFAISGGSVIYTWLLMIMSLSWLLMLVPNGLLGGTRIMMAMSFDRVLPEWVGRVDRRLHVPLNAIVAMVLVSVPLTFLYVLQPSIQSLTLGYFVILVVTFGVTMIAGVLFPFRRRDLYRASPAAKYTILGVPMISVMSAIFLAFALFCLWQGLFADELGVNSRSGLLFLVGLWGVGLVVYLASRILRRNRGESVGEAYRELPVE